MAEQAQLLEILGPSLVRLKELETKGRVSAPTQIEVANGIGFVWSISPEFQLVIHCIGPITEEGALIRVAISASSGGLEWIKPPPLFIYGKEVNPDCRYPAPRTRDDVAKLDYKILNLIERLVDDPLSR